MRRYVRGALGGTDEELSARAELVASELATNALRHGGGGLHVAVRATGSSVRIEVTDASPSAPRPRRPATDDPGGRGMLVVDAVADDWGVEPSPTGDGKVVWVVLQRHGAGRQQAGRQQAGRQRPPGG